jgi:copper chaperone CopZ
MKEHATRFAIRGVIGLNASRTMTAAVRGIDPRASVAVSLSQALVRVQSSAPIEQIQPVIEAQGFIAEMSRHASPGRQSRAGATGMRALLGVVARALLFGLLFALVVPVITFGVVLGVQHFDGYSATFFRSLPARFSDS